MSRGNEWTDINKVATDSKVVAIESMTQNWHKLPFSSNYCYLSHQETRKGYVFSNRRNPFSHIVLHFGGNVWESNPPSVTLATPLRI